MQVPLNRADAPRSNWNLAMAPGWLCFLRASTRKTRKLVLQLWLKFRLRSSFILKTMWNKNLQELELCFQRESAVGSWEDTENKFRAVHKLLLENHYDVMMVEAGAEKICTAHFDPCCQTHAQDWMLTSIESSILVCVLYICPFVISVRCLYMFIPCFPEILFLISCRLASIVAYKKMLNRNLIVWKDWNPVSWTSKSQVSILNPAFNWKVWGFS